MLKRKQSLPVKFIPLILFCICLNMTVLPAFGSQSTSEKADDAADAVFNPSRHLAHEYSDLWPDPNVSFGHLKNGIRYILMANQKPEDRVSMHLFVQAGSMHEKTNERGIAHYLEHMLFNGTEHFKPGELVKYFQSLGMRFGPDVNARTGFYSTVYDLDLPKGDRKSLAKGLLVLRDYAAGALIPSDEVEKERAVILSEKRTRDSVDYRTFVETLKFEFSNVLISQRLPIGTESVIKAADRDLLKSFYDAWYRPERMLVIVVGDFDLDTATSQIKAKFQKLTARASTRNHPQLGEISHKGLQTFYHHEPEAGNTNISIEVVAQNPQPLDSKALRHERLLSDMASRIINYRLDEMLNQPDTPLTSASMHAGNYLNFVQAAEIRAECPPDQWQAALQSLEQTLRKALTYGVTAGEMARVKKEIIAELDRRVKSAATRESSHLARQIIRSIDNRQVFQSPAQEKKLLAPFIKTADKESIYGALKNDWSPDHRLVLVTGNADLTGQQKKPHEQIAEIFKNSQKPPVHPPIKQGAPKFPYLDEPAGRSKIVHQENIQEPGMTRIAFANHVSLNIKKTDFKANQVIAALAFGGGKEAEPPSKPGLAQLTQKVVNLSGVGQLTRDELKQALAGKNTNVGFHVEEDRFVFTGHSVSEEIPLLLSLFYTHLMDPGFRQEAYDLAMRQFRQKYESWRHSIHGGLLLEGRRFFAGGDSRFGFPEWERFEQNSLADIKEWVGAAMASAPIEISVVGDFESKTVIETAKKYFGGLDERKNLPHVALQKNGPDFPDGKSRYIQVPTKINKGLVDIAYPTDDYWNIHKNRRLSVLSEVMSDRMRIDIREKMGAAYSYNAYNHPSRAFPGFGIYHAVVEIDPQDASEVIAAVKHISADLAQKNITEDELARAVNPIIANIKERTKTNEYWLNSVLKGSARHPEQIAWSRTFLIDYESITAAELSELAEQYLKNNKAAKVVITPKQITAKHPDRTSHPINSEDS